ncbi:hypothetical protein ACTG9Q_29510 [Actinokineospora sp. 24-640]
MVYAFDPFLDKDPPHGDFGIAVLPLAVSLGRLTAASALVRTWAGALRLPLRLTVSGLPDAVLARFDPHSVEAGADSQLTMSVDAALGESRHAITVTATCPRGRTARAYLTLTVGPVSLGPAPIGPAL